LQPSNAQKITNICCCCGCCCGVLRTIKRHPRPDSIISSPFRVSIKNEACQGCGTCLNRCPMDALRLDEGKVASHDGRCIGCGLCVSTCPSHSLSLVRKPPREQSDVPETMMKSYMRLARARGKLGPVRLFKMWLKSKV
jgi:formate hydrogenlyase subunit 6/NADH:ubiquinone oxidoreductase subunit I